MTHQINLMPYEYQQRLVRSRILRRYVLVGTGVLTVMGAMTLKATTGLGRLTAQASVLATKASDLDKIHDEAESIATRADALQEKLNAYRNLALPVDVSRILNSISDMLPESLVLTDIQLNVIKRLESMSAMEEMRERVDRARGAAGDTTKRVHRVMTGEITGYGDQGSGVAQFIGHMEKNPLFAKAQLEYDRNKAISNLTVREFKIQVEIDLDCQYLSKPAADSQADASTDGGTSDE